MKRKRLISGLLVVVMVAGTLFGCGSSKEEPEKKEESSEVSEEQNSETDDAEEKDAKDIEQTLRVSTGNNNMNEYDFKYPWWNVSFTDMMLWMTLFEADKDLKIANPGIMSDWDISGDGREITMTMREDLKWSDGEPITMDDVIWTLELLASQQYAQNIYQALAYVEGQAEFSEGTADSVTGIAADGNILTIKLTAPYASFMNVMCQVAPLPKHIYENCDFGENCAFQSDPIWKEVKVNSGPFVVTEHVEGNYYVLEPNPYYQGDDESKIKRIEVSYSNDTDALAQNGEIDFLYTSSLDQYEMMNSLDEYNGAEVPVYYLRFLVFDLLDENNDKKPYIDDVRIRQAIAYAIDWKSLVGGIFGDIATFTQSGVLSTDDDYLGDWYDYDPEYAKQLLDDAGFDYNHVVKLFYYYDDQNTIDLMDGIAYYLNQIGVQFEAVYTSNASVDIYENRTQDIAYFGLSGFDNLSWYQMYIRDNMDMQTGCKAIFEEAVGELETAFSEEKWKEAITNIQELEKENVFFLPVYSLSNHVWTHERLSVPENCFGTQLYFYDMQFEKWEIVE